MDRLRTPGLCLRGETRPPELAREWGSSVGPLVMVMLVHRGAINNPSAYCPSPQGDCAGRASGGRTREVPAF